MRELKILHDELTTLKKGATVYKQQRNSNILFKCNKGTVLSETKKKLAILERELKDSSEKP